MALRQVQPYTSTFVEDNKLYHQILSCATESRSVARVMDEWPCFFLLAFKVPCRRETSSKGVERNPPEMESERVLR